MTGKLECYACSATCMYMFHTSRVSFSCGSRWAAGGGLAQPGRAGDDRLLSLLGRNRPICSFCSSDICRTLAIMLKISNRLLSPRGAIKKPTIKFVISCLSTLLSLDSSFNRRIASMRCSFKIIATQMIWANVTLAYYGMLFTFMPKFSNQKILFLDFLLVLLCFSNILLILLQGGLKIHRT